MPKLFFSYCHVDEPLRDQLEIQLAMLKRQGVIETWHDRRIGAGQEIDASIDEHINSDEIILLLVSPDFIASNYCYDIEIKRSMERHDAKEAIVIPVILRPCDWHHAPFGKILGTPRDGKPVTLWPDRDEAFLQVAKEVRKAAERWVSSHPANPSEPRSAVAPASMFGTPSITSQLPRTLAVPSPRSSNLRVAKSFTQRDKDRFQVETFEYIARYFENSLRELQDRNEGYEGVFRQIDANRFSSTIYRDGNDVARATVYTGSTVGAGVYYSQGNDYSTSSFNEALTVQADEQSLYLTTYGMSFQSRSGHKLTQEGAAETFWAMLIAPLQSRR
ncbi:TIR domain-containing protein [Pseudomonas phoenicis]|uniref:TIR domain-containing protein n=1 Tax=unclassified Pseudomonas TaxID=196821 RepID=UPI0039A30EC0